MKITFLFRKKLLEAKINEPDSDFSRAVNP